MRKRPNDRKLSARAPLLSRISFFTNTEWKVSKYGVFLGQYLPVPVLFSIQENTDQKKLCILKLFKQWKCNLSEIIKFIAVTNCGKIISLPQNKLPKEFYKKAVPKNFAIFAGKHLCWSFFSRKLRACQIFKNTFFTEHLRRTTSLCSYLRVTFFFLINFFAAGLSVISFK